ncbi:MAG: DEAD/DEAH box helicase [Holophagaceae bacterium]|nr:DEAD/DEAH box helicase [Holophagaceae bacterium]
MTDSPVSSSNGPSTQSFGLLDGRIQYWLWNSGWTELRDAQEQAIPVLVEGTQDVIIAASTASGKTEAAFLPILTRLSQKGNEGSLAVYISPLKALINDQWRRLDELTEVVDLQVVPWHGDISKTTKDRFIKAPRGVLLITPESLEAMFMHHGHGLKGLFKGVQYVVVDEVHAFMGTERGKQLQSLMHRLETAVGRTVPRVGLSATLGDMEGAVQFLRRGGSARLIVSKDSGQELKVQVRGIRVPAKAKKGPDGEDIDEGDEAIARHLFQVLRGANHLVFPNSRSRVEFFADRLRCMSEDAGYPNEFWPHHGNLAKDIREETEAALKQKERPATAICTSTLELGIDIGSVKSVVQIGPPPSVASLRQRLGRSGRRKGEPAILRAYCQERQLDANAPLSDLLREGLVQTIAMIQLLIEGWYEPIRTSGIHGSTFIQQILSSLYQHGGMLVGPLWNLHCATGPFPAVTKDHYTTLLRHLGEEEIIFQDPTGLLMLAPKGERITQHYTFYAAFSSDEEFRIVTAGKSLGSMPVNQPLQEGSFLIFAGRRWMVRSVSMEDLVIDVVPAAAGAAPHFLGPSGAWVHRHVRLKMREILATTDSVHFLDTEGQHLLQEARDNFTRLELLNLRFITLGRTTHILHWSGNAEANTLALWLTAKGLKASPEGVSVAVMDADPSDVQKWVEAFATDPGMSAEDLAATVVNKTVEKWDYLLPEGLLNANYASMFLAFESK